MGCNEMSSYEGLGGGELGHGDAVFTRLRSLLGFRTYANRTFRFTPYALRL